MIGFILMINQLSQEEKKKKKSCCLEITICNRSLSNHSLFLTKNLSLSVLLSFDHLAAIVDACIVNAIIRPQQPFSGYWCNRFLVLIAGLHMLSTILFIVVVSFFNASYPIHSTFDPIIHGYFFTSLHSKIKKFSNFHLKFKRECIYNDIIGTDITINNVDYSFLEYNRLP